MAGKSLYETLEVSTSATDEEIKKSYRRLARKYHPDINKEPDAEEKFKEINAAYEILSDPQKRKQYDQFGDSMFGNQSFHDFRQSYSGEEFDINDILSQLFGGGFARAGGFSRFESGFGGFNGAFGGGFGGVDLDISAKMTISFETAILGGTKAVKIGDDEVKLRIPAGIKSGEKLRVKGRGKSLQGQRGDLMIEITVEESSEYKRDGNDLEKQFEIPLKVAIFGGKVAVGTLEREVNLKVPAGTKCGQKFRIRGEGAADRKSKDKGDLYLIAQVLIPKAEDLDPELAKILEEKL